MGIPAITITIAITIILITGTHTIITIHIHIIHTITHILFTTIMEIRPIVQPDIMDTDTEATEAQTAHIQRTGEIIQQEPQRLQAQQEPIVHEVQVQARLQQQDRNNLIAVQVVV